MDKSEELEAKTENPADPFLGTSRKEDAKIVQKEEVVERKPAFFGSCRCTLTVMSFFGVYHLMALRFNISMALVCMSSDPTDSIQDQYNATLTLQPACLPGIQNGTMTETIHLQDSCQEKLEFSWSKPLQGAILSSFFYGYILTQVLGGYTSDKCGGRTVLLYGMFVLSIGTLLTPIVARIHPYLIVCIRIIQGLASGFAFPSVYNIFTAWVPPQEKATLMSVSFAGIPTATVTIYPLVSWLCQSGLLGGWPLAFYIPGFTGLVWCILFSQLIFNSPGEHPRISPEELSYIKQHTQTSATSRKLKTPWRDISRSCAVHALWITHLCSAFGYYLIIINISLFIREALGFTVVHNGLLSMLPSLGMLVLSVTGKSFDLLRSRSLMSVTRLRKLFNTAAFFLPALSFLTLGLLPPEMKIAHVVLLSLGLSMHELAMTGGFYFSHSEIGGSHSGVLFGITNTFAQIPGFLTPLMVSYMTQNGELEEWYRVFQVSGIIYIIGGLVYLVFGTAELQPWAAEKREDEDDV